MDLADSDQVQASLRAQGSLLHHHEEQLMAVSVGVR